MSASLIRYMLAANNIYDGKNGVTLTELAQKAGVTKVSAYRAVDRLLCEGMIERDEKKKIIPTKKGLEKLNGYLKDVYTLRDALEKICRIPRHMAFHQALETVAVLNDDCRRALSDYFRQVNRNSA